MVKTPPSNVGYGGSIPGLGSKIPHKTLKNIKQKQYCNKFSKNFENGPYKKIFKKSLLSPFCFPRGLPRLLSSKELVCQHRRHKRRGFDPWFRKIPWRRKWQPTPVFLPGESHGHRNLVGYSSWGCKESDRTEHAHMHTHTHALSHFWSTHQR